MNNKDKIRAAAAPGQPDTAPPPPPPGRDASYFEKLLAYIPGDLVAAFIAIDGILKEALLQIPAWLYWAVFIALVALTPLYVIFRPTDATILKCTMRFRAVTATVAFTVWVFALGGPFAVSFDWYRPVFGSLLLVVTTLSIPVFEKIAERFKF